MDALTYPTIATGGFGPYHIGRGPNFPGIGPGATYNGVWDFDHFQPGETDSLMGWWPLARAFQSGDAVSNDDKARPFYGFDYGNLGNYVINQGTPKRTFGVVSYWHRDPGNLAAPAFADTGAVIPGPNVEWKPIGGTEQLGVVRSARSGGDNDVIDPITGNAINGTVLSLPRQQLLQPGGIAVCLGHRWRTSPVTGRSGTRCSTRTSRSPTGTNAGPGVRLRHGHGRASRRPRPATHRLLLQGPEEDRRPERRQLHQRHRRRGLASRGQWTRSWSTSAGRWTISTAGTPTATSPRCTTRIAAGSPEVVRLDNSGGLGNVLEVLTATGFKGRDGGRWRASAGGL